MRVRTGDWPQRAAASAHDDRERSIAALAARQHGIVTTPQLRALGLSSGSVAHRVGQARLHHVHRGVHAVGLPHLTEAGRQMAAVLACGRGAVLSHVDAASALGLLGARGGAVHITVPPGNGSASRAGIRVHRGRPLDAGAVTRVDVRPVTTVARTLIDVGDVASPAHVRRAFVAAERAQVLDMAAVDRALAGAGRRHGASVLRALLTVYDPRWQRTRSELELAMLDLVEQFALPAPEVNEWLLGRYLVDFLWREQRVVVETDGRAFHDTATARRDDARRDHALRRAGYRVLRISHKQVTSEQAAVAARVNRALRVGYDQ